MKKIILTSILGLVLMTGLANASVNKGKKIYLKKMNTSCHMTGAKFAAKHTQDEWTALKNSGKLQKEIEKMCPGVKLKKRYIKHIYDFNYKYASDSGYIPSC